MKIESIKKRKTFVDISKNGKSFVTKGLVLQSKKYDGFSDLKFSVTATKKLGKAVVRNKVKRRLRAAFKIAIKNTGLSGYYIVAIGRYTTAQRDFDKLVADFSYALSKINK